jgi:hypothetical protein
MMKRVTAVCVLCSALVAMQAADTYANISEAAVLFLRIASGARPAGMGEAFVALADDATATHWNPAGLGRYPLAELWLSVPVPEGRTLGDFAVVENDVPEMNYTRYDLWVLAAATPGYCTSRPIADPAAEPLTVAEESHTLFLEVDGKTYGPLEVAPGTYASGAQIVSALNAAIATDEVLEATGVQARFVEAGDGGHLRFTSGSTGSGSWVRVDPRTTVLAALWASGTSAVGHASELMRTTPPSYRQTGAPASASVGAGDADSPRGSWSKGDVYEPDASEKLVDVVRTRTGLRDGAELDLRVAQVAQLNQRVTTDSLRAWWNGLKEIEGAKITDSLVLAFENLLLANDLLNVDYDRLLDLLDEMADAARRNNIDADAAYRLQILAQRAVVPYLPERIRFPFAFNFAGQVTALASHNRTLWLGTTRGLLMHSGGRWMAFADTAAGPAAGNIRDVAVAPSGALWAATESGVSRYSSTWTHYGQSTGWTFGAADHVFVLGENLIFASVDERLFKLDAGSGNWVDGELYRANIGDDLALLPEKLFGIRDSARAAALVDSLVLYSGHSPGPLEAGTEVKIPYQLMFSAPVTAMAHTSDGTTWIGTSAGLVSLGRDLKVTRYGYADEAVTSPTTVMAIAERYVGAGRPERARLLADRIRRDNGLNGDSVAAGRVLLVFNGVTGSAIHSLYSDGGTVTVGTEFGLVERSGGNKWYRVLHEELGESDVRVMAEQSGERWYAAQDRVIIYAHPRKELTLMHVKWLPGLADDLYYEFAGYVMPIRGWGTVGANITFLSLGKQQRTGEFGDILGEFGTFEIAGTISYGTKLSNSLATGLSAKVIYSHLADFGAGSERGSGTATGLAVDMGAIWQTPFKRLDIGAAVTNLGPNISYIDASQADPLPRNMAVGFAYRLIHTPFNRLTLVGEVNKDLIGLTDKAIKSIDTTTSDTTYYSVLKSQFDEVIFNTGLEYQYGSFLALRGGYIYDRQGDIKKPTLGAGLQYRNILFDFAYIPSSSANKPLDNTTRLAISLRW